MPNPPFGASAPTPCTDVQRLQAAVNDMDALAQQGFSEISAIARLVLLALKSPDGYRHPELIVRALRVIWGKADDIQDCINARAEDVGCHHIDEDDMRRGHAL